MPFRIPSSSLWNASRLSCLLALAAQAQINMKINFQTIESATPLGYIKDIGAPYQGSTGRGWVTDSSAYAAQPVPLDLQSATRNRARAGIEPRLNTVIHLQRSLQLRGAYRCSIPNGTYKVVAAVGDSYYDSYHVIRANETPVVAGFTPSAAQEYKLDSTTVSVTDGLLVVDARGGTNTKLCYLRIVSTDAPPEPAPVDVKVNFQDAGSAPPVGYFRDYGQPFGPRTGANQGTGHAYGWVVPGSSIPLDLSGTGTATGAGRNRAQPTADTRLATLIHMQGTHIPGFNGPPGPGAWEIAVPNGWYTVTVSVGDAAHFNSRHRISIEGVLAIAAFVPNSANPFFTAVKVVQVSDGRLTLDPTGGTNTKINYVTVASGVPVQNRPSVRKAMPAPAEAYVPRDAAFTAELNLLNGPVNSHTLSTSAARIYRSLDNALVPAGVNSTGGGDAIIIQPSQQLEANQGYRVEISEDVQDDGGYPFLPFTSIFTTGTTYSLPTTSQVFDPVDLGPQAAGRKFTAVIMGRDNRLYAGTLTGEVLRYPVHSDGTLGTPLVINSLRAYNGNSPRAIIGMAFDPSSTAASPILWVSNNVPTLVDSPDWSGKITRMSGPDLADVQDYVVGLPRATKDHMTNSIAFGADGALYVAQGSRSANGNYDGAWKGHERILAAAILRVNTAAIAAPPALDVKTEEGGTYNPNAPGAPVTLYATGIRNAYDLVWHSNGSLYVAGNSSAARGVTPSTPTPLPASCNDRIDKAVGSYTGPMVDGDDTLEFAQPDLLYRVQEGKYYGHPNPARCEWVLNGGNPTASVDYLEEASYPVGTQPDRNYERPEAILGLHYSPNGSIEYTSNSFGGTLKSKMLVTRYSVGKDILVLTFDPATKKLTNTEILNIGGRKFADPLDLAEDPGTGSLYIVEYGGNRLTMLRPRQ